MSVEWLGWIVVEREAGFRDTFYCEVKGAQPRRQAEFRSPAEALDWWDDKAGERVHLIPTPLGAYRVYKGTLEDEGKRKWRSPNEGLGREVRD